jgi:hypothetical protein
MSATFGIVHCSKWGESEFYCGYSLCERMYMHINMYFICVIYLYEKKGQYLYGVYSLKMRLINLPISYADQCITFVRIF